MFLSKIKIGKRPIPNELYTEMARNNGYIWHQMLWKLFSKDQKERHFLFREEKMDKVGGSFPFFYMVSQEKPQAHPLFEIETVPYNPNIQEKDQFLFNLRANPTKKKCTLGGTKNGYRHDVLMDVKKSLQSQNFSHQEKKILIGDAAQNWLKSRSSEKGFILEHLQSFSYQQHVLYKNSPVKETTSKPIQISTIDYSGILKVEDRNLFLKTIYQGIGPAKSFGCGLLMIKRI